MQLTPEQAERRKQLFRQEVRTLTNEVDDALVRLYSIAETQKERDAFKRVFVCWRNERAGMK